MQKTSARMIPISRANRFGFTLIEILVVVSLIGMIAALYITDLGGSVRMNISAASSDLASVIKTTHDEAILKGQVFRLVFDISKGQYWSEVGDRGFLMLNSEQQREEDRRQEKRTADEREKHQDGFQLAQTVTKKKRELPNGVKFQEIRTSRAQEPIKTGTVYAYVFPHGFFERTIVYLKDAQDRQYTLAVNSVTGKTRLFLHYEKDPD